MTDPVDAALEAALKHLDTGGPEPCLAHLSKDERAEVTEIVGLVNDARGVDFTRPRPSLETLLAGTEFALPGPDHPPATAEPGAEPGHGAGGAEA